MTTPSDSFERLLCDSINRSALFNPPDSPGGTVPPRIVVTKTSAILPMSDDQLMDAGIIPDTRPPVRIPWRRRARWRWLAWRERAGRRVGGWIAGVDLADREDYW